MNTVAKGRRNEKRSKQYILTNVHLYGIVPTTTSESGIKESDKIELAGRSGFFGRDFFDLFDILGIPNISECMFDGKHWGPYDLLLVQVKSNMSEKSQEFRDVCDEIIEFNACIKCHKELHIWHDRIKTPRVINLS